MRKKSTTGSRPAPSRARPSSTEAASTQRPQPRLPRRRQSGILQGLGLVGMEPIEPVVLASLATEATLLLIGPHGTAKSLLLVRLSEALGLTFRHYNASLLNYDDLVGYPLPDESGRLRFVQTPASVWDAQAVFLDEISRCRPDMQNRLFPIIHERRVQGMALEKLLYRWAAMNPPIVADDDAAEAPADVYAGSEPLDAALADRFNFVVEVPCFEHLGKRQQEAIITSRLEPVPQQVAGQLTERIERIRQELSVLEKVFSPAVSEYVRIMAGHTAALGLKLSGRRAAMLYRNVLAVHAACLAADPLADPGDSAWLALKHSLPQRAQGRKVDHGRLLVAHNETWKAVHLEQLDPRRLLMAEPDPLRRAIRAARLPSLSMQEVSAYVADGLAESGPGGRHALALFVLNNPGAAGKLNAAVAEQVAELSRDVLLKQDLNQQIDSGSKEHRAWKRAQAVLASVPASDPDAALLGNLFAALFASRQITTPQDVDAVLAAWRSARDVAGSPSGEAGSSAVEAA